MVIYQINTDTPNQESLMLPENQPVYTLVQYEQGAIDFALSNQYTDIIYILNYSEDTLNQVPFLTAAYDQVLPVEQQNFDIFQSYSNISNLFPNANLVIIGNTQFWEQINPGQFNIPEPLPSFEELSEEQQKRRDILQSIQLLNEQHQELNKQLLELQNFYADKYSAIQADCFSSTISLNREIKDIKISKQQLEIMQKLQSSATPQLIDQYKKVLNISKSKCLKDIKELQTRNQNSLEFSPSPDDLKQDQIPELDEAGKWKDIAFTINSLCETIQLIERQTSHLSLLPPPELQKIVPIQLTQNPQHSNWFILILGSSSEYNMTNVTLSIGDLTIAKIDCIPALAQVHMSLQFTPEQQQMLQRAYFEPCVVSSGPQQAMIESFKLFKISKYPSKHANLLLVQKNYLDIPIECVDIMGMFADQQVVLQSQEVQNLQSISLLELISEYITIQQDDYILPIYLADKNTGKTVSNQINFQFNQQTAKNSLKNISVAHLPQDQHNMFNILFDYFGTSAVEDIFGVLDSVDDHERVFQNVHELRSQ